MGIWSRHYKHYLVLPLIVSILLGVFGEPFTYPNNPAISVLFAAIILLGMAVLYKYSMKFLEDGDTERLGGAMALLLLAFFSVSSAALFAFAEQNLIAWIVQVGTLLVSILFLAVPYASPGDVRPDARLAVLSAYIAGTFILAFFIVAVMSLVSARLPPIYFPATEAWGPGIFEMRLAASIILLGTGYLYHSRGRKDMSAVLLLLGVGSLGVTTVYFQDLLGGHPLVWYNRFLTLMAFVVALRPDWPWNK